MRQRPVGDDEDLDDAELGDLRRIEVELGVLMRAVRHQARAAAPLVHPDLTPAAYGILARLVLNGPVRGADLAESFGVDKAAVSRQVSHLEQLGLVVREPSPTDRRALSVQASPEGRRRYLAAVRAARQALRDRLTGWDRDDVRSFARLLAQFNGDLSAGDAG